MASGSVYGQTGPLSREWGVDGTGAALSGRTCLTGWPDRDPVIPGAVPYGDVIVPYVMAACIAAALAQRRRTGRAATSMPRCTRSACSRCAAPFLPRSRARRRNASAMTIPALLQQDVYPARGEDRWVAISVFDAAADWARLDAAGRRTTDSPNGRASRTSASWSTGCRPRALPPAALQDIEDLMEHDAALRARGALVRAAASEAWALRPCAHADQLLARPAAPFRPPGMGEHSRSSRAPCRTPGSRDVPGVSHAESSGAAGLDAQRLAELQAAGVLK